VQGFYALASGGIFGVGLGNGPAKYWVPNANTDYVFAVIGDELGLLGCLTVVLTFGLFAFTALRIARRTEDHFTRLAASGAAVWICGQALINIGYVTGLLPVTGIPLPFVSAGGTSLVLTMGVFGMLVSFARHEPQAVALAREDAEIGIPSRLVRLLGLGTPRAAVTPIRPLSARHLRRMARRQAHRDKRAIRKMERHERSERRRLQRIEATRIEAVRARAQKLAAAEVRAQRMDEAAARAEREAVRQMQARRRIAAERAAQPRAAQPRAAQPRAAQPRAAQPRAAQPRAAQPRTAQPRTAQPRTAQPHAGQLRTAPQPRSGQSGQPVPRPHPKVASAGVHPSGSTAAHRPQPHPPLRSTGTDVRR
jgi:cell division protein FtsW